MRGSIEADRAHVDLRSRHGQGSLTHGCERPATFGEWVEQWRPTTANLRPGTLVLYDYLLRRFLLRRSRLATGRATRARSRGAGVERAAEMRHVSIPQLHQLADAVPGRYRALIFLAGSLGRAGRAPSLSCRPRRRSGPGG